MNTSAKVGLTLGLLLVLGGCEEETIVVGPVTTTAIAPVAPGNSPDPGPGAIMGADAGVDGGPEVRTYRDEEFVEGETNRDPFRNYAHIFQIQPPEDEQGGRDVVMPDTAIDEMRLIAIVSGVANARAMLVDGDGVGHPVRRGEYLGRSEIVQAGGTGALPVTLNWRVDRIRPGEVVLTREDPTAPNRPPLTRVLALREDDRQVPLH